MEVFTALLLGSSAFWLAQVPEPEVPGKSPPVSVGPPVKAVTGPVLSSTDRVARLVLSLEADRQQLERLKARLEDPQSEYRKAQSQFKKIDASVAAKRREILSATEAGQATLVATR